MANIHGDYTPNFARISDKLAWDKISFVNINGYKVHPRQFIWLRMENSLQPTLVTMLEATMLTLPVFEISTKSETTRSTRLRLSGCRDDTTTRYALGPEF